MAKHRYGSEESRAAAQKRADERPPMRGPIRGPVAAAADRKKVAYKNELTKALDKFGGKK